MGLTGMNEIIYIGNSLLMEPGMAFLLERIFSHTGSKELSPTVGANSLQSAPGAWDDTLVERIFSHSGSKFFSLLLGPGMALLLEFSPTVGANSFL